GLLDPVAGVGAEARVHRGIESLDGAEKPQIAFFYEVLQAQSLAGVAAGNVDHEAKVGAHHPVAGFAVAVLDPVGQLLLFVGAQKRRLVDLAEVRLEWGLDGVAASTAWSGHGGVIQRQKKAKSNSDVA